MKGQPEKTLPSISLETAEAINFFNIDPNIKEPKPVDRRKLSIAVTGPDIEFSIPAPEIFIVNPNSERDELPAGSLSPYFPEYNGRFSSSSNSSQGANDIYRSNSPISVHNIPNSVEIIHSFPSPDSKFDIKNRDMVRCEVCQRQIKSKSLKAHLRTRIHKNNLKSST